MRNNDIREEKKSTWTKYHQQRCLGKKNNITGEKIIKFSEHCLIMCVDAEVCVVSLR